MIATFPENVRVEIESESAMGEDPARVLVYNADRLVAEVIAEVKYRQGADGGYYPCVILSMSIR